MNRAFDGLGAAFYPEQQQPELIGAYIRQLADSGIRFVRMAEFAWGRLEPTMGQYDFGWLDAVMDELDRYHIEVILCTPTASPPVWLARQYPEMFPRLRDDATLRFGTRHYYCPGAPEFRTAAARIVRAMGEHYRHDARVIGWQVDNEFGEPLCFCERCRTGFSDFCRRRFGTVAAFNAATGADFWGALLQDFNELELPDRFGTPGRWLLYHQYFSELVLECFDEHFAILREAGVSAPVSTNTMLTWYGYDAFKLAERCDYACGDYYFSASPFGDDLAGTAFVAAYLRALKPEKNFRFHEFECAREFVRGKVLPPGRLRRKILEAVALGADHVALFRWDACLAGNERDAYAVSRSPYLIGQGVREAGMTGTELAMLTESLQGTMPERGTVALLYDYLSSCDVAENPWMLPDTLQAESGNGYAKFLSRHFRTLFDLGLNPEIVFSAGEFSPYQLLIVPALYIVTPELAAKLADFAAQGGRILFLPLCGIADANARLFPTAAPGPLTGLCGVRIAAAGRAPEGLGLYWKDSDTVLPHAVWYDELIPDTDTEVVGAAAGFFHEAPLLVRRRHGRGEVYTCGTWFDDPASAGAFYQWLLAHCDVVVPEEATAPPEERRLVRAGAGRRIEFVFGADDRVQVNGLEKKDKSDGI